MILTSVDVPTSSELLDVTRSSPFVCVSLKLQPELLTRMLAKQSGKIQNNPRCFEVERPVFEMLEDFERLLILLVSQRADTGKSRGKAYRLIVIRREKTKKTFKKVFL